MTNVQKLHYYFRKNRSFVTLYSDSIHEFHCRNFSISISRSCCISLPAMRYSLLNYRHLGGLPTAGFSQRRHHTRLVRRNWYGLLFRSQSSAGCIDLCHTVRMGYRNIHLPQTDSRRLCNRFDLVVKYGYRHYFHLFNARIRAKPDEFPFWEHSECHLHRHYLDGHCRCLHSIDFRHHVPTHSLRRFRQRIRPQSKLSDSHRQLSDGHIGGYHHCHFDSGSRNCVTDLAAHHSGGNWQPDLQIIQSHFDLWLRNRCTKCIRRALYQL